MRLPPRTGWMSAQSQPPVNGGPMAVYEHRCLAVHLVPKIAFVQKDAIAHMTCLGCQWRGLTKPGSK